MLTFNQAATNKAARTLFWCFERFFLFCSCDINSCALVWQKFTANDCLTKYRIPITSFPSLANKNISFEFKIDAGWSSLVARWAHNPKVVSSNLAPATKYNKAPN